MSTILFAVSRFARAASLFLASALLLGIAPNAAAYDKVCVFGKPGIGYHGKFRLVWGVPDERTVWGKQRSHNFPTGGSRWSRGFASRGATHWSSQPVRLGVTRCVNTEEIPSGERFVVEFQVLPNIEISHFCVGWEDRRARDHVGILTNDQPGRTLHIDAYGSKYDPWCRPAREE